MSNDAGDTVLSAACVGATGGRGMLGRDFPGFGQLLGRELGLIVGLGQRHGELPGTMLG